MMCAQAFIILFCVLNEIFHNKIKVQKVFYVI